MLCRIDQGNTALFVGEQQQQVSGLEAEKLAHLFGDDDLRLGAELDRGGPAARWWLRGVHLSTVTLFLLFLREFGKNDARLAQPEPVVTPGPQPQGAGRRGWAKRVSPSGSFHPTCR